MQFPDIMNAAEIIDQIKQLPLEELCWCEQAPPASSAKDEFIPLGVMKSAGVGWVPALAGPATHRLRPPAGTA